jgi:hypothetical protein
MLGVTVMDDSSLLTALQRLRRVLPDAGVKALLARLREENPGAKYDSRQVRCGLDKLKARDSLPEAAAPARGDLAADDWCQSVKLAAMLHLREQWSRHCKSRVTLCYLDFTWRALPAHLRNVVTEQMLQALDARLDEIEPQMEAMSHELHELESMLESYPEHVPDARSIALKAKSIGGRGGRRSNLVLRRPRRADKHKRPLAERSSLPLVVSCWTAAQALAG